MATDNGGMNSWNATSVRDRFRSTALEAEAYLKEIYPKTTGQPEYKNLVDDMIAKFYAFDALGARAWNTSAELVIAAQKLLEAEVRDSQAFDDDNVKRHHRNFLNGVVNQYQPK